MNTPKEILTEMVTWDRYSFPARQSLRDFIALLRSQLESVPEEFRGNAYVNCEQTGGYDEDSSWQMVIAFRRPETAVEAELRERAELQRRDRYNLESEARERQMWEQLKEKYGHG